MWHNLVIKQPDWSSEPPGKTSKTKIPIPNQGLRIPRRTAQNMYHWKAPRNSHAQLSLGAAGSRTLAQLKSMSSAMLFPMVFGDVQNLPPANGLANSTLSYTLLSWPVTCT